VAEDRFDHALAFGVEPAAAVGLQDAAHEAVEAVEDDELGAGVATDDPGQFAAGLGLSEDRWTFVLVRGCGVPGTGVACSRLRQR
jgi:hypothetical protein